MTKWRFLIISFLLVFVACSNRNSITVAVKKLYGRSIKINWDDEVIIKKESSPSTPYHMRPVKILLSFDANECIECFRNNIIACANYSDHLPKEYVSIICLVPFRREDIIANVCDLYLSDLCIISDVDNQFAKTNKVEEYKGHRLRDDIAAAHQTQHPRIRTGLRLQRLSGAHAQRRPQGLEQTETPREPCGQTSTDTQKCSLKS